MKTERRHELQTNELADWLGDHATAIQPYFKTIIGVAILAIVGFLALFVMRGQNEGRNQAAWTNFFEAQSMGDADTAKEIARRFPDTAAAPWAWQWAGDYELTQASSDAFVDRADSREGLLEARDAYEAALASDPPPLVQRRALLGLAQVHEAMNELDEAEKYYQQVADSWPASHAASRAIDRIGFLRLPETRDFANWFAKQKPRQQGASSQTTSGITPPTQFDDLADEPDLSLPDESALQGARSSAPFDSMAPPEAQPQANDLEIDPPNETDPAAPDTADDTNVENASADQAMTETPVTESPVTESPVTESPVTESPVTETPVTESPVTETPVTETPVTEGAENEGSQTQAAETEDTQSDDETAEESAGDTPGADDDVADQPEG